MTSSSQIWEQVHLATIPGEPHPLQRARHKATAHGMRTYDTPENVARKETVRLYTKWRKLPLETPIGLRIVCNFTTPKPRADVDNLAKLILDAYNKYVFKDDRQVMWLEVSKRAGQPVAETVVEVYVPHPHFPSGAVSQLLPETSPPDRPL